MRGKDDPLSDKLVEAIKHMVANISKSFIVEWYKIISPTNHDFVASCETLIENALSNLAELCANKLDKYKIGQLVTSLLHEHILSDSVNEKIKSINAQIDDHEYDICQSSVVRLFGLLSNDELRRVIFTKDFTLPDLSSHSSSSRGSQQINHEDADHVQNKSPRAAINNTLTTSALYTLVIAMLTKAVFMPIVNSISEPKWLYAVIIWICKKELREKARRENKEFKRDEGVEQTRCNNMGNSPDKRFNRNQVSINNKLQATSIIVTNTRSYRSLDLEEGIDMASANINFENPICDSLKRPLDNIEIYATEEVKSTNSCYVLYCISYDGLCYRHPSAGGFSFIPDDTNKPIIDKRATNNAHRRLVEQPTTSSNHNSDISCRKSFRRRMVIKRRFREFVLLQLRLEENPKIRPYMKNIPKPTKLKAATQNIFSLPGITNIKLDQSTIKLRQRFLERFLIALNNSPFIANSYEFKEFFSYNVNSVGINLSKSKSLILQVNLNKVFVDSVRSALSMIRASLPGDDHHLSTNPNPDAWLIELQQSTLKLHVQTRTSHSKMNLERCIDSRLTSLGDSPMRCFKTSSLGRNRDYNYHNYHHDTGMRGGSLRVPLVKSNSYNSNTDSSPLLLSRSSSSNSHIIDSGSRSSSIESVYFDASSDLSETSKKNFNDSRTISICDSVPIASKFIDIVHYSISKNPNCNNTFINFVVRLFLGKAIERYATELLELAFTLETAAFFIDGITSSIWDESDDPPLDLEHASLDEAVKHLTELIEQSYTNHPFIPKMLARSLISKQMRFYLSQLASQKRNKFVIYSFFVHLLDELETVDQ